MSQRPSWLGSTIVREEPRTVLVDEVALYWGVRRLVFDYTSKSRAVKPLQRMIGET